LRRLLRRWVVAVVAVVKSAIEAFQASVEKIVEVETVMLAGRFDREV
jgi:hypothetical protein